MNYKYIFYSYDDYEEVYLRRGYITSILFNFKYITVIFFLFIYFCIRDVKPRTEYL